MTNPEREWMKAVEKTWVVRFPRQSLATFGVTNIAYYVVTEPLYQELQPGLAEGVVRTGRVKAERPAIVTPTYALGLQGFSPEAYEYLQHLAQTYGPNSPGILYRYRNEAEKMDIVGGQPADIASRISKDLDSGDEAMSVVMVGVDQYWDVALLKFIYEFTSSSLAQNVNEFQTRGLLEPHPGYGGVPRAAIQQIEEMFRQVEGKNVSLEALKDELDRWGLFELYQDRFFSLFRQRRA